MPSSIHALFQTLISDWLARGRAPTSAMEGIAPGLARFLNTTPEEFSFDSLFQGGGEAGWEWKAVRFPEMFDGPFMMRLPAAWSDIRQKGADASVRDAVAARQSLHLVSKERWRSSMSSFLEGGDITGFAFYPLHPPYYLQWLFVVGDGSSGPAWAWSAYSAGDSILLVKGDAVDGPELKVHLASLVNSNPWHGWIEAARAQQDA
jgi:hypothetical protein